MKRSIKRFKSVVFIVRQTWVLAYFPFATSSKCRSLFLTCFLCHLSLPTNNAMLESSFPARKNSRIFLQLIGICRHFRGKWKACGVEVRLRSSFRNKLLKQYGAPWMQYWRVEIHSIFSIILWYSDIILLGMERWVVYYLPYPIDFLI